MAIVAARTGDAGRPNQIEAAPSATVPPEPPAASPPPFSFVTPIEKNGRMAFERVLEPAVEEGDVATTGVFVANRDGSDLRLLARGARSPAWDAIGNRVYYVARGGIYVHDLPEGRRRLVVPCRPPRCDGIEAPVPRLFEVAFRGELDGRRGVWLADAHLDTDTPPRLLLEGANFGTPVWARWRGALLVLEGSSYEEDQHLVFIRAHSGRVVARVPVPDGLLLGDTPAWSPNRTSLVAVASRSPNAASGQGLYLLNLDGTVLRRLTRCRGDGCVDSSPTWSPDGTTVVFTRFEGFASDEAYSDGLRGDVMLVDVATGATRSWTDGPDLDCCATWEPSLPVDF